MLSKKHVNDICNLYSLPTQCRYLEQRTDGKFCCLKLRPIKKDIDITLADFMTQIKSKDAKFFATGNNCDGYPMLNNIEQGYDKD